MPNDQVMVDEDKDRAIRLFSYLREFVRLRSTIIRDISSYEEVLWFYEIPNEHGWYSAHWGIQDERTDDAWIEAKKPKIPECPLPPTICDGWYFRNDLINTGDIPAIQKVRHVTIQINDTDSKTENLRIEDYPAIENEWNKYIENKWFPWMEAYEKIRPSQEIYGKLFRMYQLSNKLGESYELILGIGFLTWKTKQNQDVQRHIISAQARLEFDSNTGTLTLRPGIEGAKMVFENDMLDPSELPPHEEFQAIESTLQEDSENPWDSSIIHPIIRSWVYSLSSESAFSDSKIPPEVVTTDPKCNFAPAIILRKRTQRGWITAFDNIIKRLKLEENIPNNTRALVNISDSIGDSTGRQTDTSPSEQHTYTKKTEDSHVYFPLPTNDEQLKIIQKLHSSNGVRVQGPPGTGKSHTIANIICHYLATDKKILVTAYAPRALKVLQDKIPQELLALCVSVLGHDTRSMENLQRAVNEITEKFNDWNEERNNQNIHELQKELNQYKEESAIIKKGLRELKEKDTYKFCDIVSYEGTVQEIAKLIKANEENLSWIPDRVEFGTTAPLSNLEFKNLLYLLRDIEKSEEKELTLHRIKSNEVPDPDFMRNLFNDEKNVKEELNVYQHYSDDYHFKILMEVDVNKRQFALELITELRKAIDEGLRRSFTWLNQAVLDILTDNSQPLQRLFETTRRRIEGLDEKAQIVDDYQIKLTDIDKAQIFADANDLLEYLKSGKNIYFWPFQPKVIRRTKYLWHETYIDGRPCDNIISLDKILDFLDVDKIVNKLWVDWSSMVTKAEGSYVSQVALIYEQLKAIESVLAIDNPLHACKKAIKDLSVISEPKWHESNELIELEKRLKASVAFESEKNIKSKFKDVEDIIDHYLNLNNSSAINLEFSSSVKQRDLKGWSTAYYKLKELEARSKLLSERKLLYQTLKDRLPELADELINSYQDLQWDHRGEQFEEAWKWSLTDTWLQDYEAKHDSEKLNASYVRLQQDIGRTTAKLAAKMAWAHCLNNMTNEQRTALLSWQSAIRRIGSGKRKGSVQAQRDAAHHMKECRKIIPAWIMPLYRVIETISETRSIEPEIFDVVIVDEASQCGPEALIVHFLAKKVIIVGDEEQVAPENIGVQEEDVQRLRTLYLDNIPAPVALGRDSTLFENAGLRLRERVFLREHFRCMPEIIQFCNDLCYAPLGKALIPLRQYGTDRLEPPIVTEYVESGYRDKSSSGSLIKMNHSEAKRIVDRIMECCNDQKYANKTMGVISMLGDEQAKLIEGMLMKNLSPAEYEKRKLLCGTSASFQGDERDIIFISMVDAPPSQFKAITKDTDKRRFNVAVSRAKDQLWLFHSFQLSDLNSVCFRHRLLRYCKNPHRPIVPGGIEKCETQFEKDVFFKITQRGYRVIPQVEVAGKFIDLVIEGMRARLAVECDGDKWHGPERWDEDMERQRTLERCGWRFWRVRGSEFYRSQDEAMSTLWDQLDGMQIYPYREDRSRSSEREEDEELIEKEIEIEDNIESDDEMEIKNAISDIGQPSLFQSSINSMKDLDKKIIREIIIHLLNENSRGKDLLPTAVIRRSGLAVRGYNRSRVVNRINRVVNEMLKNGEVQQYKTQKRMRFKLPDK